MHKWIFSAAAAIVLLCALAHAQAHFTPGVANIRDYSEPEPGLYAVVYNYGYTTSTLR